MSKTDPKTAADTTTAKKTTSKKEVKGTVIDHLATSPSKNPDQDEREKLSAATEPNSAQRMAERVERKGGRNNGGGDAEGSRARPGLEMAKDLAPDTLGEREGVSPAETDLIWTNASKDKWGGDQPALAELLAQRNAVEEKLADA